MFLSPPEPVKGRGGGHYLTVNIFRMQEVVFLLLSTVLLSPPEPAQGKGGFHCSAGRHLNIPPQIKHLKRQEQFYSNVWNVKAYLDFIYERKKGW